MFLNLFNRKHSCKRTFDGLKKGDCFHFIAMGGVGQSALAKILLKLGYKVSGSDVSDSKYLQELKTLGARVFIGHNSDNVPNNCFVVLSSAIKEDNLEYIRAKELGLTVLHRSDLLRAITHEFALTIGFAGTHGKTTTSGLCSYVLEKMNKNAAFAVGGIIPELNTNAGADKNSTMFVAELDESDGTIVKYTPEIFVINNLEADHLDYYKNGLPDVLNVFKTVASNLYEDCKIIVNIDDKGVLEFLDLIKELPIAKNIVKFSVRKDRQDAIFNNLVPDILAKNIVFGEKNTEFEIVYKNNFLGKISTSLKGIHNVYNALAVITSLIEAGFDFAAFAPYFKGFTGMGRRFQTVFKDDTIEIIDDYAHHPSEIKTTLKAAKEYKEKSNKQRVVAIFQPHRYTRLKALWNEFLEAFDDCDKLIIVDTYSAGDEFDFEFNSKNFREAFKAKNPLKEVNYIEGKILEIPLAVRQNIKDDDVVLTLGAGDITKLGALLGETLVNRG